MSLFFLPFAIIFDGGAYKNKRILLEDLDFT